MRELVLAFDDPERELRRDLDDRVAANESLHLGVHGWIIPVLRQVSGDGVIDGVAVTGLVGDAGSSFDGDALDGGRP